MKQVDPVEICAANVKTARTKSDAERQALRACFPFAVQMVAELTAAGFKPKVLRMIEGDHEWQRNASR